MLKLLVLKEMHTYFSSPKFVMVFSICSMLMLLSVFLGIQEYQTSVAQYNTGTQLALQDLRERNSWMDAGMRVFREPDPMQIFVAGISNDIGRISNISEWEEIKLRHSPYSDDPIFAAFRFLDFSFIIQVVFSLLAILFTFDAVSGERESGTLKLIFANAVPRTRYLVSKFIGSWLGLFVPLLIPLLLSLLLILLYNIRFDSDHWFRLMFLIVISALYYTFFILCGIAVSALTRTSATSFLSLLVLWVLLVLIIPRISVLSAANVITVPGAAETDARIDGFSTERWKQYEKTLTAVWERRNNEMTGMNKEERKAYEDERMWQWMEEDEQNRHAIQSDISEFARKLKEDVRNRKEQQQNLAFSLSRFSPASAFSLAAMNLAGNGIDMKPRYEKAMDDYKNIFNEFIKTKREENKSSGGIRITFDSENGFSFQTADMKKMLDTSELAEFVQPKLTLADIISYAIIDFSIILFACLMAFAISWVAFLRYDLR